jgi:23S rRNA (guanine745-N1)-methyltransferase
VNLLSQGSRRRRQPGDSPEMIAARRRFLATGAYDPLSDAVAAAVMLDGPETVLDIGCGEGRHTRAIAAGVVMGVDVAKAGVAAAARSHPAGWYAVASAARLPLDDGAVQAVMNVFGPVTPAELARVVAPGGVVVAAYPGTGHLAELRCLVYKEARDHEVKPPLRHAGTWFVDEGSVTVNFQLRLHDAALLSDLFTMTPYRWHAPTDIRVRIEAAVVPTFETVGEVHVTRYRRTAAPWETNLPLGLSD